MFKLFVNCNGCIYAVFENEEDALSAHEKFKDCFMDCCGGYFNAYRLL